VTPEHGRRVRQDRVAIPAVRSIVADDSPLVLSKYYVDGLASSSPSVRSLPVARRVSSPHTTVRDKILLASVLQALVFINPRANTRLAASSYSGRRRPRSAAITDITS